MIRVGSIVWLAGLIDGLALLLPTAPVCAAPNAQRANRKLPLHEVVSTGEFQSAIDGSVWPYRLYIPANLDPKRRYPFVLWLHGEGESGKDNRKTLRHLDTTLLTPERQQTCEFFILIPQKPAGLAWFGELAVDKLDGSVDMLEVVAEMLDKVVSTNPIDNSRVSVMGLSSGGAATWEMGARHPEQFTAVMPFSAAPSSSTELDRLIKVPVWAFYSPTDYMAPPDATRDAVDYLKSQGAPAAFTLSNDEPDKETTHYCWKSAFRDYDLYDWLLQQSSTSAEVPPPGRVPTSAFMKWSWVGPYVGRGAIFAIGLVVVWATVREVRQRRRKCAGMCD